MKALETLKKQISISNISFTNWYKKSELLQKSRFVISSLKAFFLLGFTENHFIWLFFSEFFFSLVSMKKNLKRNDISDVSSNQLLFSLLRCIFRKKMFEKFISQRSPWRYFRNRTVSRYCYPNTLILARMIFTITGAGFVLSPVPR